MLYSFSQFDRTTSAVLMQLKEILLILFISFRLASTRWPRRRSKTQKEVTIGRILLRYPLCVSVLLTLLHASRIQVIKWFPNLPKTLLIDNWFSNNQIKSLWIEKEIKINGVAINKTFVPLMDWVDCPI